MLVRLLIFLFTGLVSQASAQPQQGPTPQRPALTFSPLTRTQAFEACRRAVLFNLVAPVTTGDIEQACACVDRAFLTHLPKIPESFRGGFIVERPEGEVLGYVSISSARSGDLAPSVVRVAAERMTSDVRGCLEAIPTRGQMFGEFPSRWRQEPPPYRFGFPDYSGETVAPVPGPPREVDLSPGGLATVDFRHAGYMVQDHFAAPGLVPLEPRMEASNALRLFGKGGERMVVLACRYRTVTANGFGRTEPYYYWYEPKWTPVVDELRAAMPSGHPILLIGRPMAWCPIREPKP